MSSENNQIVDIAGFQDNKQNEIKRLQELDNLHSNYFITLPEEMFTRLLSVFTIQMAEKAKSIISNSTKDPKFIRLIDDHIKLLKKNHLDSD
jgi:hypothetical protein